MYICGISSLGRVYRDWTRVFFLEGGKFSQVGLKAANKFDSIGLILAGGKFAMTDPL